MNFLGVNDPPGPREEDEVKFNVRVAILNAILSYLLIVPGKCESFWETLPLIYEFHTFPQSLFCDNGFMSPTMP